MIEVKGLYKDFDGRTVLENINIKFEPGKCSLIIGASGSGKTVMMKNLIGLYTPSKGEILYGGTNFANLSLSEKKVFRKEMGVLFQGSALFDFATVEENVMFQLDFFTNWSYEEKLERVNFCLKRVNLENVNHLYPSQISGGMQKRVGIARAIAMNPKFLFCDEPNSGLDPTTSIVIDRLIQEITQEYQMTTVINTHDMNSVMEIGDHIGFIHKGCLEWEGSNKEIMDSDCQSLNDFVFANNLARQLKRNR